MEPVGEQTFDMCILARRSGQSQKCERSRFPTPSRRCKICRLLHSQLVSALDPGSLIEQNLTISCQQAAQAAQQQATMEAEGAFAHINTTPIKALPLQTTASVVKSALSPLPERAKAVHGQGASSGSVFADAVGTAKKLAKQTAHAKRMRQRLAREAARAVKEEQAATLGGIRSYGGRDGAGPPVLSRSMTVIFVTVTVAAIMGVIWYVRQAEPKKDETDDDKLFAQSSQQYV